MLLDAAMQQVLEVGFRRTTLTDVARRAGVSRMTVYRRYADVRSLVADLMTREFGDLLAKATASAADARTERERLVSAAVAGVARLWSDPLFVRVLDVDPELLLPYMVVRVGATQRLVEGGLRASIDAGQADGSIRAGDPAPLCRGVYLLLQSFALSVRPAATGFGRQRTARKVLLGELAQMLDGALRPVPASSTPDRPVRDTRVNHTSGGPP